MKTTPPPNTTSMSPIDHSSSQSDNGDNQVQKNNLITFEFWLPLREVLGYFIPIILIKKHAEDQIWFNGILDESTCRIISATIGRTTFS